MASAPAETPQVETISTELTLAVTNGHGGPGDRARWSYELTHSWPALALTRPEGLAARAALGVKLHPDRIGGKIA
jgi:hypothetical protein